MVRPTPSCKTEDDQGDSHGLQTRMTKIFADYRGDDAKDIHGFSHLKFVFDSGGSEKLQSFFDQIVDFV